MRKNRLRRYPLCARCAKYNRAKICTFTVLVIHVHISLSFNQTKDHDYFKDICVINDQFIAHVNGMLFARYSEMVRNEI